MSVLVSLIEIPLSSLGLTVRAATQLSRAQCIWEADGVQIPEEVRQFYPSTYDAYAGDIAETVASLCKTPKPAAFSLPPGFPLQEVIAHLQAANLAWEYCPALPSAHIAAATIGVLPKFVEDIRFREWDPATAPPSFSKKNQPLVFSAAAALARTAVQKLIDAGWPPDISTLRVVHAGTCKQKTEETQLQEASAGQYENETGASVFFISQPGFHARAELSFFERRALFGKRILTTRAEHQAGDFLRILAECGAHAESLPTIKIVDPRSWEPLDAALEKLRLQSVAGARTNFYEWIFFTSVNGVESFWQRLRVRKLDMRVLGGMRVCAIGPATAAALAALHIDVDLIPAEFKAEGVIESFIHFHGGVNGVAGRRILLPRARVARDTLPVELAKLGARLDIAETYQTVCPEIDAERWEARLRSGDFDAVTFTSSSTVTQFAELFPNAHLAELLQKTSIACIGPITGDTAKRLGLTVAIQPKDYTIPALAEAIVDYFRRSENI